MPLHSEHGILHTSGVGGHMIAGVTQVDLFLTPKFILEGCVMHVIDFPGNAGVLIGMDIISMGDFAVCNADGKTSFSFVAPPLPDRINFAEKIKQTVPTAP